MTHYLPQNSQRKDTELQETPNKRTQEGEFGGHVPISYTKKMIQIGHPQGLGHQNHPKKGHRNPGNPPPMDS